MTDPAIAKASGRARTATSARIQFVMAALAVCGAVTMVGWLSGLRAAFHGWNLLGESFLVHSLASKV
jgi:hypothetical protein